MFLRIPAPKRSAVLPSPVESIPANPSSTTPPRTFWQRRVRDPIVAQLTQGITPEKIALTLAVGAACALFPILGATTLLCFLAGIALRLNQPLIQLINQLFWPLHVGAIYGCVRLGETLFHAPHASLNIPHMSRQFRDHPGDFWREFGATGLHAIGAWIILAPFFIAAVYYLTRPFLREIARLKAEAATKSKRQS